ncbi:hypothetical protein GIB67_040338 [Kingdonia uniflora]|uniref:Uncharacterized protein n=1 Tax=Kingdonia uniflora TaxID=39325 RepID=A0A7J7L971_9MAGN|nr:hypothetical protein GIB67_040338 [Kingdonia uniflora]
MSLRGIEFHTEESPQAVLKASDGSLSLKTDKGNINGFSHIMFATGRKPDTKESEKESRLLVETLRSKLGIYGDPKCIIVTEVESFKQIGLQMDPEL